MLPEVERFIAERERARTIDTRRQTWTELAEATTDPLVKWIATNPIALRHAEYTIEVLQLLPAELYELDEYARKRNLCGKWGNLKWSAVRDGVIPTSRIHILFSRDGRPWERFFEFHQPNALTRHDLVMMFAKGVTFLDMQIGSSNYKFRLHDEVFLGR